MIYLDIDIPNGFGFWVHNDAPISTLLVEHFPISKV